MPIRAQLFVITPFYSSKLHARPAFTQEPLRLTKARTHGYLTLTYLCTSDCKLGKAIDILGSGSIMTNNSGCPHGDGLDRPILVARSSCIDFGTKIGPLQAKNFTICFEFVDGDAINAEPVHHTTYRIGE